MYQAVAQWIAPSMADSVHPPVVQERCSRNPAHARAVAPESLNDLETRAQRQCSQC